MKTFRNVSLAAAAVFALSACAGGPFYTPEELDKAKKVTPTGSAFNKALYKDYLDLSVFEKEQEDLTSIGIFAHRAIVAGSGKSILPEEIAKRAGGLYDKFVGFTESMEAIGGSLDKAKENYDVAMSRMGTGHGNILRRIEQLKDMGAKTSKSIPDELLEDAGEEDGGAVEYLQGPAKPDAAE